MYQQRKKCPNIGSAYPFFYEPRPVPNLSNNLRSIYPSRLKFNDRNRNVIQVTNHYTVAQPVRISKTPLEFPAVHYNSIGWLNSI